MGWSIGYDPTWKRDIGYGVPAKCDHPGCNENIDRGLSYVCGGQPYGGDKGCGLYFCDRHLLFSADGVQLCRRCRYGYRTPFAETPDTTEWVRHKLTDESWAQWRAEHPDEVAKLRALAAPSEPAIQEERDAKP